MPSTVTIQLTDEQIALLALAATTRGSTPADVITTSISSAIKAQLLHVKRGALPPGAAAIRDSLETAATPASVTITKS
jgi:hypothetical protein